MCKWRPVMPGTFTDVQVREARGALPLAQGGRGWVGEGKQGQAPDAGGVAERSWGL